MGRLSAFLEVFKSGTHVKLISKNGNLIFDGVKEDIPHRFEDQVTILLGETVVGVNEVTITTNYDDESGFSDH